MNTLKYSEMDGFDSTQNDSMLRVSEKFLSRIISDSKKNSGRFPIGTSAREQMKALGVIREKKSLGR